MSRTLEFRSEGAKTFTMMSDTLKVTPYAGVKFVTPWKMVTKSAAPEILTRPANSGSKRNGGRPTVGLSRITP